MQKPNNKEAAYDKIGECFLAKQTPEALEKAGFGGEWFDQEYQWYMENLSYALLTLGASKEEILEIFKEELDIQDKFYRSGDLA